MQTRFINERISYTGRELRSHFAYHGWDICGDSLVAFRGPCHVKIEALVDLEDAKAEAGIFSEEMLHFMAEFFELDLEKMILRQRLLIAIIKDELALTVGSPLVRKGDDIYDGDAKLTVSIATLTPVSAMIHLGVNIRSDNTPVKTKGLHDYGIDVNRFAEKILASFAAEMAGIRHARCKVRGVR